jgi:16S rRNA processing protein RimM
MRLEDCFFLGSITRKHGKDGGLVIHLETDQPENYYKMESVLLDNHGELVPFFIEELTVLKSNQLRVFFEDFSTRETHTLIGKDLYLPLSMLPKLSGKKFYYHEIEGFTANDIDKGNFGIIKYVIEREPQPLIVVEKGDKEIYIPAIDEFIERIDRAEKVMYFQCPEGLLDLYL